MVMEVKKKAIRFAANSSRKRYLTHEGRKKVGWQESGHAKK